MSLDSNNETEILRAAWYVDGFNIYHALAEMDDKSLKWLDLSRLAKLLVPQKTEEVTLVRYFSALRPDRGGTKARHNSYMNALRASGVTITRGHYVHAPQACVTCGHVDEIPSEKQTDINMALAVLCDAQDDLFDVAYLLTADSDHAATFRVLKERFPQKGAVSVLPPDRPESKKIMSNADRKISINRSHLENCRFPMAVRGSTGWIRRPREYDPPRGLD